jgi:hypothetical protein
VKGVQVSDIVEALLSGVGLYCGPQLDPTDTTGGSPSIARILVTALPGGAGVSMDYEVLSCEGGRVHAEHAVLARTTKGLVLVTAHNHSDTITVVSETEPGYFPAEDGNATYPMAIRLEVPEPGQLVYSWSYGSPGEPLVVRDVGTLRLIRAES